LAHCAARGADPEAGRLSAVRVFDSAGAGKVRASVVRRTLASLAAPCTPAQAGEALGAAGFDADGNADATAL
jgi:hypothetical protein